MRRQRDLRIRVSFTIPGSLVKKIDRIAGPKKRSRLAVEALLNHVASLEAQQKASETSKYQLPLTVNQ